CAGVDVDAGFTVRNLCQNASQQWQAKVEQGVSQSMADDGSDAGITEQHFIHAACCRVTTKGGNHITVQQGAYAGQLGGKVLHQSDGLLVGSQFRGWLIRCKLQLQQCLFQQQVEC